MEIAGFMLGGVGVSEFWERYLESWGMSGMRFKPIERKTPEINQGNSKIPGNGDIDPELTTYCNQERPLLEELAHQHSHRTNVLGKRWHRNCKSDQA